MISAQVYCAHLQRMSAYDCGEDTAWRFWKGNDPEDGQYYLCDNLAWSRRGVEVRASARWRGG